MSASRRNEIASVLGILAVAVAVRLIVYSAMHPLMEEDAWLRVQILNRFFEQPSWPPGGDFGWPPGFNLLMLPAAIFSRDATALTWWMMLLSLGAPLAVYFFARELSGPEHALGAGLLAAAFPQLAEYSTQLMTEPIAAALTVASFALLVRHARAGGGRGAARAVTWSAFCLGLASFVRIEMAALIPVITVFLLARRDRSWLVFALVAGALPALWIATNGIQQGTPLVAYGMALGQQPEGATTDLSIRLAYWPGVYWRAWTGVGAFGVVIGLACALGRQVDAEGAPASVRRLVVGLIALLALQTAWATVTGRLVMTPRYGLVVGAAVWPFFVEGIRRASLPLPNALRRFAVPVAVALVIAWWGVDLYSMTSNGHFSSGWYLPPENDFVRSPANP